MNSTRVFTLLMCIDVNLAYLNFILCALHFSSNSNFVTNVKLSSHIRIQMLFNKLLCPFKMILVSPIKCSFQYA